MDDLVAAYFNVYGCEAIQENFCLLGEKRYVISEAKEGKIKATFLPKSRERDIGIKSDWNDPHPDSLNWGEKTPRGKALARRARAVIGTQRRQDKEVNLRQEDVDYLLDILINEGYTNSYESAICIFEAMSEKWVYHLLEKSGMSAEDKRTWNKLVKERGPHPWTNPQVRPKNSKRNQESPQSAPPKRSTRINRRELGSIIK